MAVQIIVSLYTGMHTMIMVFCLFSDNFFYLPPAHIDFQEQPDENGKNLLLRDVIDT